MSVGRHVPGRPDPSRRPASARPGTWFAIAAMLIAAAAAKPSSAATPQSAAAEEVPEDWSPYRPGDGSLQIYAPDPGETTPVTGPFGPAHLATFDHGALTVAWTDTSIGTVAQDAALLTDEVSRIVQPIVGMVADEEEKRSDLGHPGFGLAFTAQGVFYRIRVFAAEGRLFEILGKAPAGSEDAREAARFVESFTLQ